MDMPEEDELVLCTIKKILPYGAFCALPEYENAEAFLHISEVAARWIKNIHEFISEGQRHVAKVYRIDKEKSQIDISLKRVSEEEKKTKLLVMRQEKRAEKLLELALAQSKEKITMPDLRKKIEDHFGMLYDAFQRASENEQALASLDLPESIKKQIVELAAKNIKKPSVTVNKIIKLICYQPNGIEIIKQLLQEKDAVHFQYLGAPRYKVTLNAPSYKDGEKKLTRIIEDIKSLSDKNKCEMTMEK